MTNKKIFNIPVHSVILIVGPTYAGKSHFCKNHLMQDLAKNDRGDRPTNIQYVSSDNIRRGLGQLHPEDYTRFDNEMLYTSKQAFDLLYAQVEAATSYPVNAEYVIVDTKGLSDDFRGIIVDIAKKNNYNVGVVVLDYKDREDYYKNIPQEIGEQDMYFYKNQISKDVSRLRKETMAQLKKSIYGFIHKVTSNDFSKFGFESDNFQDFKERILNPAIQYHVIGDVHGCLDELKELVVELGFEIQKSGIIKERPGHGIILVGDIVDKGPKIKETIEFVYKNCKRGRMIMTVGNHENFVVKFLRGQIKQDANITDEFLKTYMNSIFELEGDEKTQEKLFELFDHSKEFYIHRDFIVTHAPCKSKYLGKMDGRSLRNQRMKTYQKSKDFASSDAYIQAIEEEFSFMKDEAERNQPYHLFGHVQCEYMRVHNKVNLDTGCVSGGRLTAAAIPVHRRIELTSVESKQPKSKELLKFFGRKQIKEVVDMNSLDDKERTRIKYFCKDQIPYISGTMCPADKDESNGDIESLEKAIEYYKEKGITKLIMQPKYMGSRCNVFLHKDLDKCYSTTRKGYILKQVEMEPIYKYLHEKFKYKFEDENVKAMLIDSELMPWSAMGKGLVNHEFVVVGNGLKGETEFMKQTGFDKAMSDAVQEYEDIDFENLVKHNSKKELVDKLGNAKYNTMLNLKHSKDRQIPVGDLEEMAKVYDRQMELYGQEGEIHIKPFMILKEVFDDDTEKVYVSDQESNISIYDEVGEDAYCVIDLDKDLGKLFNRLDDGHDVFSKGAVDVAKKFNEDMIAMGMEGIVLKPDVVYTEGVAPFLKVRNKEYLTIIYGPDYTSNHKYEKLMKRKRVRSKLKTSIKEYEIGRRLLNIPISEINEDNDQYKALIAQMISEEKRELSIDPRL